MIKKAIWLFCLLAAFVSWTSAQDMTLDEVLAKHFEAVGGLENVKAIQSAKLTGKMSMGPGLEAPVVMLFKRPMKLRMEFTVQGMTGIQAYDGQTAWMVMPFMGKTEPEVMAEDQAKSVMEQADFDGPLVDWKEKGHQVELVGKEEVDGTETYKIKTTLKNGDVRYQYMDTEYFLMIKQSGTANIQGNEVEMESTMSDYKEVGGLMLPHVLESRRVGGPGGQSLVFDSIELNVDIDDGLFSLPAK
ncbi:MAG: outer membrane lipoprotein-sorting protein [Acidobacteriota bacterium]|nr:MAG: outer membrane lipoprotein-sorting protein [Acidobacteriota bacterium]